MQDQAILKGDFFSSVYRGYTIIWNDCPRAIKRLGCGAVVAAFLWNHFWATIIVSVIAFLIWASGPWVTRTEYLLRYKPEEYIKFRFYNPDGSKKRPFNESGFGEPFCNASTFVPAMAPLLQMQRDKATAPKQGDMRSVQ